nr:hypothetical protein [Tanacetum cinerariifolium]
MSAMANTTPIVTTVTKAANKEKAPKEADAALKVNILEFCEEHYEDILPDIMDKIRRDKRKEVHVRLDFGETFKKSQRVREGSQNSSDGTLPARYRNPSERPKMRNRLRHNDENVFDRLGHRRGRPRTQDSSPSRDRPRSRDRLCGIEESYCNTCSTYRIGAIHRYHSHDRDRSRSMKKGRESESPLSRVQLSANDKAGFGHDGVKESKVSETITSMSKVETSNSKTSNDKVEMPKIETVRMSEPIIEEWEYDSEYDEIVVKPKEVTRTIKPSFKKIESVNAMNETVRQAKNPRKNNKSPRGNKRNWNGMMTQKLVLMRSENLSGYQDMAVRS